MKPRKIEYSYDEESRSIVLPEGAPFDGKPVLIRTNTGWVEAWWEEGRMVETHESTEYEGFCWVCYDDKFDAELDEALEWLPLPLPDESALEPVITYRFLPLLAFFNDQLDRIPLNMREDARVSFAFEESDAVMGAYEINFKVRW